MFPILYRDGEAGVRVPVFLVPAPIGTRMVDMAVSSMRHLREVRDVFIESRSRVVRKLQKVGTLSPAHRLHVIGPESPDLASRLIESGEGFAILADTGTPCFVDPGHGIIARVLDHHLDQVALTPLGMSSALDAALAMCGLDIQRFAFAGHHPENVDYNLGRGHTHPVVLYVAGGEARTWAEGLGGLLPGWDRATLFCNIRSGRDMAVHRLRPGAPLPAALQDRQGDNCVAVVER